LHNLHINWINHLAPPPHSIQKAKTHIIFIHESWLTVLILNFGSIDNAIKLHAINGQFHVMNRLNTS
ncbi:MAG: hypothetical protein J6M63_09070, partial [Pseudobutyrivibrio sp.]|nr:hypothetical protein [Pseudobutyrivibrio sp.]